MNRIEIVVPDIDHLKERYREGLSKYHSHDVFGSVFGIFEEIANRIMTPRETVIVMLNEINGNFRVSGTRWLIVDFMSENVFPSLYGENRKAEAEFKDAIKGVPDFWLRRPKPPRSMEDDSRIDD